MLLLGVSSAYPLPLPLWYVTLDHERCICYHRAILFVGRLHTQEKRDDQSFCLSDSLFARNRADLSSGKSGCHRRSSSSPLQTDSGHPRRIFAVDVGRCVRLSGQEDLTKKTVMEKKSYESCSILG